jgi:hypothetical protein
MSAKKPWEPKPWHRWGGEDEIRKLRGYSKDTAKNVPEKHGGELAMKAKKIANSILKKAKKR